MTERFQQARWSDTRKLIHAMKRREVLTFPADQYFNCHGTVQRLNDQFSGERRWIMTVKNKESVIERRK